MAMAEIPAPARRPLRFGSFELDPASGELRKAGVVVALPDQSLKVLVELLERPGDARASPLGDQLGPPDQTSSDVGSDWIRRSGPPKAGMTKSPLPSAEDRTNAI